MLELGKPYAPAVASILLAIFFAFAPGFALFIVVGGLFAFGAVYAIVVSQLIQKKRERESGGGPAPSADSEDVLEPTFRNVTMYMLHKDKWLKMNE